MDLKLVPAPLRQLKTYSMMLIIATGVFNLALLLVQTLSDLHVMSAATLAIVDAGLAFATGVVRLVQQQIPATTEEKVAVVAAAAINAPVLPGHADVTVQIDGATVVDLPPLPKEPKP